jgi:hypothetical protein
MLGVPSSEGYDSVYTAAAAAESVYTAVCNIIKMKKARYTALSAVCKVSIMLL